MLIFDAQTHAYLAISTRGIDGQPGGTALLTTAMSTASASPPTESNSSPDRGCVRSTDRSLIPWGA
jgi:hypothetical protein